MDDVKGTRGVCRVEYRENVPVSELDSFLVNPHQRNTIGRAPKAAESYLSTLEDPHLEFAVGRCLEDGQIYMANGHTRREVYTRAMVPASQIPATINLTVYECETLDDVLRLEHEDMQTSSVAAE
jgi:hypothetical protein